ncbi:MAG: winged helix-turn-helix transcriptional regulator [Acidimicrobiales bacterium]|nr:winged helix-turn-helix transcriptional regulator [Acidimicrobiales bacterium]MCB9392394.1 winged helix-turn-helix transcriptional regulator [Acidimicrobiaceae bacterium]
MSGPASRPSSNGAPLPAPSPGTFTGAFATDDATELRDAERDVTAAFVGSSFDFSALLAVSNVFRTATAVRNHMEREVLGPHQLSWSAFVVLFVLRVWGAQESGQLAREAGITGGTLTGVLTTLERKGFAERAPHPTDRRRVVVSPTGAGLRAVDEIMPLFNEHEAMVTSALTAADKRQLSRLLRAVLRTLDDETTDSD